MSTNPDLTLDAVLLADCSTAPRWSLAFSGGLDSSVLLHLLVDWRRDHPGSPLLRALHVNHGLQPGAGEWARRCEAACRQLEVPCVVLEAEVAIGGRGREAAAREARYDLLQAELDEGEILFLAHHLDDQVETVMLRLLRGTGLRGLAGMPARRVVGCGTAVRPMLDWSRAQLERYARAHELEWIEDPSNADPTYDRNFLRAEVLPRIATRWPAYRQTVARAAAHLAEAERALERRTAMPADCHSALGDPGLPLAELDPDEPASAAGKLRAWLRRAGCEAPDRSVLEEFLRQLRESGEGSAPVLDAGGYRLQRFRDAIYLLPGGGPAPAEPVSLGTGQSAELPGVGRVALRPVAGYGLRLGPDDMPALEFRRGGERCRPVGRARGAPLKKVLQDAGVPPWWRDRLPLLYLQGELLAVGGIGPCESSRWHSGPCAPGECWELCWEPAVARGFD